MSFRIKEIIMIILLVVFVVVLNQKTQYKEVKIDEIESEISETAGLTDMTQFDSSEFKKKYGLNSKDYSDVMFYGHESEMECQTVLIVRLKDSSQGKKLIKAITQRREDDMDIFKSYAPDQHELLDKSILEQKGKYVIYIAASNAYDIETAILKLITR